MKLFIRLFVSLCVSILVVEAVKVRSKCPPDSKQHTPITIPVEGLPFCSEYKALACCDAKDVLAIRGTVLEMMRPECSNCYKMVAEWKCAECHPNAGIFYEGDCSTQLKVCRDYCHAIFETCKDIPFYLDSTDGAFYLNDPPTLSADDFCEKFVGKPGKCFSGSFVPTEEDTNCKCEDHKCHLPTSASEATMKESSVIH